MMFIKARKEREATELGGYPSATFKFLAEDEAARRKEPAPQAPQEPTKEPGPDIWPVETPRETPKEPEPLAAMSMVPKKKSLLAKAPVALGAGYDPEKFVDGLTRRGFSPAEAAAVAGNVHVESSFYPGIKSSVPGENSHGFMQWNGPRLRGLQNFASATGRDWRDPEAQLDWIALERDGGSERFGGTNERGSYERAFGKGGTPGELAVRVGRFVERPLDIGATAGMRARIAERLLRDKSL